MFNLFSAASIPFQELRFHIWSVPDGETLAAAYLRHCPDLAADLVAKEKIHQLANETTGEYRARYGKWFKKIGDPHEFKTRLDETRAERLTESSDTI